MRSLRFSFAALLLVPIAGSAQTIPSVLSEDEAVRIAQASPTVTALGRGQLELARSDISRVSRWPNPIVEYTRESAADSEQFLTLSQVFDFSGRRALLRRAAELRLEAAQQGVATEQLDLARVVRSEFNRAATQQQVVRALREWSTRIASAAETAARLQAGGEVSGYDRRRLDRERIGAEARLAAERGALVAAQRRLAALLGVENLDGITLQPPVPGQIPPEIEIAARIEQRPDVSALARRIEAATLEQRATQRWRVPLFDLTAGTKRTEADTGTVLGAGFSVPIFNRNQDEVLRTKAELVILTAQRTLLVARARSEAEALAAEARELRHAAHIFREQARPTSLRLTAIAEASYRAGEVGILELLDAYRTALDAEIEAAELEQRARAAEIELRRALGGATP